MRDLKILTTGGSLCFWGEWFGRPYDNYHRITHVISAPEQIKIIFDNGETLTISCPAGIVNEPTHFEVKQASEVIWRWGPYDGTAGEGGTRELRYRMKKDGQVTKQLGGVESEIFPAEVSAVKCVSY